MNSRCDRDSKMNSKISDVSSSQNINSRFDMNNSAIDKNKDHTSEYFDSGVISDAIVSSEFSSEIDIHDEKPVVSDSSQSSADLSSNKKTETSTAMTLDSGIDIDFYLSDQINSRSESLKCEKIPKVEVSSEDEKPSIPASSTFTVDKLFAQDEEGDTQLHNAVLGRCEEVVKYLVFLVPNSELLDIQNNDSQTCLHLSVLTNQPRITRLLLLAGARAEIEDRNGSTALHLASGVNSLDCVEALLTPVTTYEKRYYNFKYTPEIDSPRDYINKINYEGLSCVHIAANRKYYLILHRLLMNGADVNIRECKSGYTLLHEAVASGNIDLVRYILQHPRLNLETKNYATYTAYQLSSDYPAIARILVDNKASELEFFEDETDDEDTSDSEDEYESDEDFLADDQVSNAMHALRLNDTNSLVS